MINMTTAQRDTLERKWSELDESTRPTLERFLDSVKDTFIVTTPLRYIGLTCGYALRGTDTPTLDEIT